MTPVETGAPEVEQSLLAAVSASRGHFRYESGHHGDLWLELEGLFVDARRARSWAAALTQQIAVCQPDFICGPLTGGAFVAQLLAVESNTDFAFAERFTSRTGAVHYRIPQSLRGRLSGKRVLLVDDAVNAGSALRSTVVDVLDCGSTLVGLASLLTLGAAAIQLAQQYEVPFFTLAALERRMWAAEECPLCGAGMALINRFA